MSKEKDTKDDNSDHSDSLISDEPTRNCWTCDAPLYHCPYVKCMKCPEMEQCIQCFSTAAICEGHGTDHPFVLMDYYPKPLTREDWSGEEEALLLFGIQMCGVGNWNDISKVIITKTPREIEKHYYQTYIESETAPLPPNQVLPPLEQDPPLPYDTTPRDSRPSLSHELNLLLLGKESATTPAEYAGWMPKRHEFEIEYINEAEELISDLVFDEKTETSQSFKFKIGQMLSYNVHLQRRHRRTELALKWDLLNQPVMNLGGQTEKEIEVEQKEIMPMAQALSKDEIMDLASAIHEEQKSERDLKTLIEWKKNGIKTFDEGYLFNQLDALYKKKNVTDQDIHDWNEKVTKVMKTPGFRQLGETEILTQKESRFLTNKEISPSFYMKIKEQLLQEFEFRGHINQTIVNEIFENPPQIIFDIYEYLKDNGQFISFDYSKQTIKQEINEIKKNIQENQIQTKVTDKVNDTKHNLTDNTSNQENGE